MPAQDKHDTLSRLLELLKALPHHRWETPKELRDRLASCGFDVDVRSVQRDLKELQKHFPIDLNDKGRPHGWRWSVEAAGGIASMSTPEALMVVLVQKHLQSALPAAMLDGFESLFSRARQRLHKLGPRSSAARWPDKVQAVPPGIPSAPPVVEPSVQRSVANALLEDRQLEAVYVRGANGVPKSYVLHPIGLVVRGAVTYLLASAGGDTPMRKFALHRFRKAEMLPSTVDFPAGMNLTEALRRDGGQFGVPSTGESLLNVVFICDAALADVVEETPLGQDQVVTRPDAGSARVSVSLADSWELRWWLMARADTLDVLSPASLRTEIRTRVRAAAARYVADDKV